MTSVMTMMTTMASQTWCPLDRTTAGWSPTQPRRIATVSGLSPGLRGTPKLPSARHTVARLSQGFSEQPLLVWTADGW